MVPGGYIEQAETGVVPHSYDGTLDEGNIFQRWRRFAAEMSRRNGKSLFIADTMKQTMIGSGFVDVVEHRYRWPIGTWSSDEHFKELGRWNKEFWIHGMEGWMMASGTRLFDVSDSVLLHLPKCCLTITVVS